jgi:hypothetical protein
MLLKRFGTGRIFALAKVVFVFIIVFIPLVIGMLAGLIYKLVISWYAAVIEGFEATSK